MVCIELFFFYHFVVISEVLNEVFYGTWKLADIWIWSFELPLLILWLFLILWSRTDWSFLFSVILSTVFSIYMLFLVFIFAAFSVFYLYLLLSTVFLVSIYIYVSAIGHHVIRNMFMADFGFFSSMLYHPLLTTLAKKPKIKI